MGQFKYANLGKARSDALINATRDNCDWIIDHDSDYNCYWIRDKYTRPEYSWEKPIEVVKPAKKAEISLDAVILTPEEKALVAAVLDPQEPGREFYPGSEKTKTSLWRKLTGKAN